MGEEIENVDEEPRIDDQRTKRLKGKGNTSLRHKDQDHPRPESDPSTDEQKNKYPYEVLEDDHCETPIEAYADLSLWLQTLCADFLHVSPSSLRIYDPYYCEGQVKERLHSLGFTNVHNVKEDFYRAVAAGSTPDYDVLVTNPPYSADHMPKLLDFCVNSLKPFCLLLPNYVYMKDYYPSIINRLTARNAGIFYITPKQGRRYLYTTPKGRRQQKSAKITSPFPTFWYCSLPKVDLISR